MIKKLLKIVVLAMIAVGIIYGIGITIKKQVPNASQKEIESKIFNMIQTKTANITSFYTYGRALNLKGEISGVNEDNFESVKLLITDGIEYEKEYKLNYELEKNNLKFISSEEICGISVGIYKPPSFEIPSVIAFDAVTFTELSLVDV